MKGRMTLILGWWVLVITSLAGAALPPQPWYLTLRPGVTRSEILQLSGDRLESRGPLEMLATPPGELEFEFRGETLMRAIHRMDLKHPATRQIYTRLERADADLARCREFLQAGNFITLPSPPFDTTSVRTARYEGICYEVDGRYLMIEPILYHNSGFFLDKAARVLLVNERGEETVLYRAIDHWEALRPPGVTIEQARERENKLRQLGNSAIGLRIGELFGPHDSRMGSGRDMRVYYLPTGLAILGVGGREPIFVDGARTRYPHADYVNGIAIVTPGAPGNVPLNQTFDEWLSRSAGASR